MPDVSQVKRASISVFCREEGTKNARSEFFHLPLDCRTKSTSPPLSHCSNLPVKFPHFKGQKNDANYETLLPLSLSSNFSSLKALLLFCYASPLDSLSLSGAEVIIYVSKNPSTFFSPSPLSPPSPSFLCNFSPAQFSWVLFIPRDKGREGKK